MTENDKIIKRHLVLKSIYTLNFIFFAADILVLIFVEILLNLDNSINVSLPVMPIFQSVLFLSSFMIINYFFNLMHFNRLQENGFYNEIFKSIFLCYKGIAIRFSITILNFIFMKIFTNNVFAGIFLFCYLSGILLIVKLVNVMFKLMTLRFECED